MKLGVNYYPEQWPEARWQIDAKMMAEMGLTYVRLGEFAWSLLEPGDGVFDFAWLERVIETLRHERLQIILGTPTASPPPWLTHRHDIFQRDQERKRRGPGSRRYACANNDVYVEYSRRIVMELAQQFGRNETVIGWQVDNAFGSHGTTCCFCDACHTAFQRWLKERYKTLDRLNEVWGTVFWSAIYTEWNQIPLPWNTPAWHNPGLALDFRRFSSASWVNYQQLQVDILRQYAANQFITHNFMGSSEDGADQQDYYDLAAGLDLVAWDNYPQGSLGPEHVALNHDMMRGIKRKPYWVMEQQPGVVNWHPYNRPVPPNLVRLWSYQALGHGAEATIYFRWRAARYGQEQYHMGVLRQDGSPTRLYFETGQVGRELRKMPAFFRRPAQVAILFDYADWWTLQIEPHQQDFSYLKLVRDIYRDLWAAGIGVDVIRRSSPLDDYVVVIVPAPILIDRAEAHRWQRFVEDGGRLMVTFRAFVKEESNIWTDQPLPAHLSSLLGTKVEEYLGLPPDMRGAARDVTGRSSFPYWRWAEILEPTTAQPLMLYNQFYWRDRVAVTVNQVGQGLAVMVGCWFEHMLPAPVWQALDLDTLAIPFKIPPDMEAIPIMFKTGEDGLLLLNHKAEPSAVHLDRPGAELLLDFPPMTVITLPPRGVGIVKFKE